MAVNPALIKVAIQAVKNPNTTKKILKILLTVVLVILIIPAAMLQSVSILFDEKSLNHEFNIRDTEVYKTIYPEYEIHIARITEQMNAIGQEIIEEHTVPGDPETGEESYCTVEVYITVNHNSLSSLFAYLTSKDSNVTEGKKFLLDSLSRENIESFYGDICTIYTYQNGDSYYIENVYLSKDEIVKKYFNKDPTSESFFLESYAQYEDFFGEIESAGIYGGGDTEYDGKIIYPKNGMPIPLYTQGGNRPWSNVSYGNGNIATSGCAPTAIAMIVTYLTGQHVTPDQVVAWTGNRYYVSGAGSSWGIFSACANNWYIKCTNLGTSSQKVVEALKAGKPVIASMKPGTFTSGGHFIVLRGITQDGKILVNDPNDNEAKNFIDKEFDLALIIRESKQYWSFSN